MKRNRSSRLFRRHALGSVCMAVAAMVVAGGAHSAQIDGAGGTVDATVSVQNVQVGSGPVTATQVTTGATPTAAQVRVEVGDSTVGSSMVADSNTSVASGTSNSASNSLALSGNSPAGTTALQNVQTTGAAVSAVIGLAGTPAVPGVDPGSYPSVAITSDTIPSATFSHVGKVLSISSGTMVLHFSGVSGAALSALQSALTDLGFTVAGSSATAGPGSYNFGAFFSTVNFSQSSSNTTLAISNFNFPGSPGTPAVAPKGGVTLAVGGNVTGSALSVDNNSTSGSATGNKATNGSVVSANTLDAGTGRTDASGGIVAGVYGAWADHTVSNAQTVSGAAPIASEVNGSFDVDAAPGVAIGGSSVSVSGNSQSASAVANTADSSLAVSGTNVAASGALASYQAGNAAVAATSNVSLFAPGAVTGSTVDISGNRNTALGVINDATNAMTVTATNIDAVGPTAGDATADSSAVVADQVLSNRQTASTSASGTARTEIYNGDHQQPATAGLNHSALSATGNATVAEASANRADNSLALNASASQGADAGIRNVQQSSAAMTSDASTTATFALEGSTTVPTAAALNQSSATLGNNSTSALARGNAASNTLDVSAGGGYAASTAPAGVSMGTALNEVMAGNAVLNIQGNSGAVSATATASYTVALNPTSAASGIVGGTVGVNGNTTSADASGNSTTNRLTLAALNTGTPSSAIGGRQQNSGSITAIASGVQYGIGITGASQGSMLRVAGNQVSASAVGNSAISSIVAR
jgi:hypothetical protein